MKGTFLSASASRVATPFFCNIQGSLNKGFYLTKTLQSCLSSFICHQWACHNYKYIYFPTYVNKKMHIAKNIFPFGGSDREKARWERIRNAKNSHSSLLVVAREGRGHFLVFGEFPGNGFVCREYYLANRGGESGGIFLLVRQYHS